MTDDDALADAYNKALELEKSGDFAKAAIIYQKCLVLDPSDICGASVRLASMGATPSPKKAPDAYVATLFDQHADDFDDILTGSLGYAVPMQVASILNRDAPGPYRRLLDLGCGTGLSGMMLQEICDHSIGVDLSENMIDKSDERACYDELFVNEAVHFLEEWAKSEDPDHLPFDLIVATDVLPYIGALEPLFEGIRANSEADTRLVLSSETLPDADMNDEPWRVTPNQRFAHSKSYLQAMCENAGFSNITHFEDIVVRSERGAPIPGYLFIADRC